MNNPQPQHLLSTEQRNLATEIILHYGLKPDDIRFYTGDADPFIGYEASNIMANVLIPDLLGVQNLPVESLFADSLAFECTITKKDGSFRGVVGHVNRNEKTDAGDDMTSEQLQGLGQSRAFRAACRAFGIDLIRLHRAYMRGEIDTPTTSGVDRRGKLLAQVNILGKEVGLIVGDDRSIWRANITNRYHVTSSTDLSIDQLENFAAFLRALRPNVAAAA